MVKEARGPVVVASGQLSPRSLLAETSSSSP